MPQPGFVDLDECYAKLNERDTPPIRRVLPAHRLVLVGEP